jgi:hypothetical protein
MVLQVYRELISSGSSGHRLSLRPSQERKLYRVGAAVGGELAEAFDVQPFGVPQPVHDVVGVELQLLGADLADSMEPALQKTLGVVGIDDEHGMAVGE